MYNQVEWLDSSYVHALYTIIHVQKPIFVNIDHFEVDHKIACIWSLFGHFVHKVTEILYVHVRRLIFLDT